MENILSFLNPGTVVGAIICSLIAGILLAITTLVFSKIIKKLKRGKTDMDYSKNNINTSNTKDNNSHNPESDRTKSPNKQKEASIQISKINLKESKINGGLIIGSGKIQTNNKK